VVTHHAERQSPVQAIFCHMPYGHGSYRRASHRPPETFT
jgi:hypothetical protein